MPRPVRYNRKKRKARSRRVFFFLLLLLLCAAAFQGYRWMVGEATATAALFISRVAAGDEAGAGSYLAAGETGLQDLIALFQEEGVSLTGVGEGRLDGLAGGRVDFHFTAGGLDFSAPLTLARRDRQWHIRTLPEIKTIDGAYVKEERPGRLQIFWEGQEKSVSAPASRGLEPGAVVNIRMVGDTAVKVEALQELILSRLLRRGDAELEGEREGNLRLKQPLVIYREGERNSVKMGTAADLVIGMEQLALFLDGEAVVAVKVNQEFNPRTIRVVLRQNLNNLTGESLQHRLLRLSSEDPVTLEDRQNDLSYSFAAGRVLLVEPVEGGIRVTPDGEESLVFYNRVVFRPGENGTIFIHNLERAYWEGAPPAYRGSLEITHLGGQMVVVNEPTLEQYLYTVVPSEMQLAFGLEALKAQAVAARSYAYTSICGGRYGEYGAHVDDSILSQVYHNTREYPLSTEAVEATTGTVLFYQDKVVDARFFSTSCGYTANYHEVWHDSGTGKFPPEPIPYLKAVSQVPGESIQLHTEDQLRRFLQRDDWPAYDQDSPYFRWRVEMTGAELEASINHNLGQRFQEQPEFILTREGDEFRSMEIPRNPLGRLLDIRVAQRGEGGNIMVLEVEGSNGTYQIVKEYNVRFTVRPVQYLPGGAPIALERRDGSRVNDYFILPSAFAVFELTRDSAGNLERVVITGGGNGHGVGMSQHGARGMALLGSSFAEILRHYYPESILRNIYE